MANPYSNRVTTALENLSTAETAATLFQTNSTQNQVLNAQKAELQGNIQELAARKSDIDRTTETYEKEFIDRKKVQPAKNPWFQTLQDMILALFFFSYLLISLAITYMLYQSNKNVMEAAGVGVILFAFILVLSYIIVKYG
jgi:multidrug resistance efflux pump